ncbi:MAG: CcmD family protein [Desulfobacterales bacterium]|nr:CcmD family protein [Desulfobacterales bacterium]
MGTNIYLLAAYALTWVILFAFILLLLKKQKTLKDQVEDLKNSIEKDKKFPQDSA